MFFYTPVCASYMLTRVVSITHQHLKWNKTESSTRHPYYETSLSKYNYINYRMLQHNINYGDVAVRASLNIEIYIEAHKHVVSIHLANYVFLSWKYTYYTRKMDI